MNKPFEFNIGKSEMKRGLKGEAIVEAFLKQKGYEVKDMRDDWECRKKDIDFLATKDGKTISIEAKSSSTAADTGILPVEDILNCNIGLKGWIWYCHADLLMVSSKNKIFIYEPAQMRHYLMSVEEERAKLVVDYSDIFNPKTNMNELDKRLLPEARTMTDAANDDTPSKVIHVPFADYISLGYYGQIIEL